MASSNESFMHKAVKTLINKRVKRPRYENVSSSVEGFELHVEAGKRPMPNKRVTRRLGSLVSKYIIASERIEKLNAQRQVHGEAIKEIIQAHDGLRGIRNKLNNQGVTVYPRQKLGWNFRKFREALGLAAPLVISEFGRISITIPLGYQTEEGPLTEDHLKVRTAEMLISMGMPEKMIHEVVHVETERSVNEEILAKLLDYGEVRLPEDVATISEEWAINRA